MSSTSPKVLLQRLGLRPKKTLGQHFLVHPHQARRIVEALGLRGDETVVEIGAGLGALTVFLARQARRLVALERDPALVRFLREEVFPETPGVEVRCQDVLRFDFLGLSREVDRPLVVAGNLPYQITSPLLFKLMEEQQALSRAVLMMQQEVGARLLAAAGSKDYGVLSVLLPVSFLPPAPVFPGAGQFFPAAPGGLPGPEPDARHHLAPGPGPDPAGPGGEGRLRPTPQDPEQHPDGRGRLRAQPRRGAPGLRGVGPRFGAAGGDPEPVGIRGTG